MTSNGPWTRLVRRHHLLLLLLLGAASMQGSSDKNDCFQQLVDHD